MKCGLEILESLEMIMESKVGDELVMFKICPSL